MKKSYVLIIEDDEWMAAQHCRVLEKAGCKTKTIPNAYAAIDMIDKKIPNAIILDVLLPVSTGFALLHELQSYADTDKIPIIICTNLAPEIAFRDVEPYGVKRVIDKSTMEPDDLVAAVRSVL